MKNIRISDGPIRVTKCIRGRLDSPITFWGVNQWGYINKDLFDKIRSYEELITEATDRDSLKQLIIKKMKSLNSCQMVYEFNAEKGGNYYRMVAVLNNQSDIRVQKVSLFDAYIKYPLYALFCTIANKIKD